MTLRQYTCPEADATCHNTRCHLSLCLGTTQKTTPKDDTYDD